MAALLLRVDQSGTSRVLTFKSMPIRLGRDKSNECRLEFSFVSRTHATIDIREGRLMLRDEHSKQGTWSLDRDRRFVPGRWESLGAMGYAFRIGAIELQVEGCDGIEECFATPVVNDSPPGGEPIAPLAPAKSQPRRSPGGAREVLDALDPLSIERAVRGSEGWERHPTHALWAEFVRRHAACRAQCEDGTAGASPEVAPGEEVPRSPRHRAPR